MNKVYKVLFNKSTGKYVVVSENSKSAKKSSKTIQSIVLAAVAFGGTSITMAGELALRGGTATGTDTIAIGERSNASGILSMALGANSVVEGINSVAIGSGAKVLGNDSVAIGTRAKALANYSTALGNQATAETAYDFAAGYNANASGGQSMALGFAAKSKGVASTAIGSSSLAAGNYSIAIGQESRTAADKSFATALGYKSNASGWASFAQGSFALASGDGSISIGDSSSATGKNSIAIGGGASRANLDNSVALGSQSKTSTDAVTVTSATVGDITYGGFTGAVSSVGSQISVGNTGNERQIKHVAAGTISQTSTDAINGSQLFSTQKALGNLASSTSSALGGGSNVQPDGSLSLPTYVITNNPMSPGSTVTVNNVGDALTALDQAVNTGLVFNGNTGNNITKKLGDTLSIKGDLANADAATATNLRVDEENGELKIKLARNLTDLDSVTVGNTVLNPNGLTVGGPTGPSITTNGINAGDKAITNVAPGVNGTDAVNVDQLTKQTAVATTEVKAADGDKNISVDKVTAKDGHSIYNVGVSRDLNVDTVTLPNIDGSSTKLSANGLSFVDIAGNPTGPMVTANGIDAGNQKITNVAPAIISKESKDAVNGSQLYNLGNNINNIFGGNASYNGDIINWTNIGGTGHNNIDDAIKSIGDQATNANKGWNIATDNGVTSNVKPNDTVNINGDKKSGIIISNVDNNITVGLADKVNIGDKIKIDGTTGEINAGQIKIDGNKGTVNNLTNTTWNGPDQITSGQAATEDQLAQAVNNVTNQTTAAKTEVTQGENIVVTSSKASDGHTIYNVETAKDVKFNSVKSDVVQVGNVQIDKDGINAGKQKVTNVEAGTISKESKDAVNGSQLYQSNQNIANYLGGGSNIDTNGNTTAPTYNVNGGTYNNVGDALGAIGNRVTNVQNNLEQAFHYTNKRIDDVENNANAGTAQALATAGLPQAYIPGKSMMAISGGTFRGESGYAIGFSSISDNGRWVIKTTGSGNSRGDFGGTVGGGIQW